VVVTNVPANATVVGVPGQVVAYREAAGDVIERLPDPAADRMAQLEERVRQLEERLACLEGRPDGDGGPAEASAPAQQETP